MDYNLEVTESFYDDKSEKEKSYTNKAVISLNDYWHLKGFFSKAKKDPIFAMTNSAFHECLFNYLTNHTVINKYKFWSRLDTTDQLNMCKYITIQEECPILLSITCEETFAQVYVVLSGTAIVTNNRNSDVDQIGIGKLFGTMNYFDKAIDDPRFTDETLETLKGGESVYKTSLVLTVKMTRGSLLRLSIDGYKKGAEYEKKMAEYGVKLANPNDVVDDDADGKLTDCEIPEGYTVSVKDDEYIRARNMGRKILAPIVYDMLGQQNLLPKLFLDASSAYLHHGRLGDRITLSYPGLEETVYVVISGSIRLQIDRKGKSNNKDNDVGGTIVCKTSAIEGERNLRIKVSTMPIMLLDAGSVLSINEQCFQVGQSPPPKDDSTVIAQHLMNLKKGCNRSSSNSSNMKHSQSLPALIKPPTSTKKQATVYKELYRISLKFDKDTTYLAIPYSKVMHSFARKRRKLLPHADILHKLFTFGLNKIIEKVTELLPWINGSGIMLNNSAQSLKDDVDNNNSYQLRSSMSDEDGDRKDIEVNADVDDMGLLLDPHRGDHSSWHVFPLKGTQILQERLWDATEDFLVHSHNGPGDVLDDKDNVENYVDDEMKLFFQTQQQNDVTDDTI